MADIAEKLRATTIEMASSCSVDMHLWNAHSNAALAAISEIDRLRALNAEMREALMMARRALYMAAGDIDPRLKSRDGPILRDAIKVLGAVIGRAAGGDDG